MKHNISVPKSEFQGCAVEALNRWRNGDGEDLTSITYGHEILTDFQGTAYKIGIICCNACNKGVVGTEFNGVPMIPASQCGNDKNLQNFRRPQ